MVKKKDPLKKIGIILIIVGVIVLLGAIPTIQQSAVNIGGIIEITDIPPVSATMIGIGAILIILGLIVYLGKNGLKAITRS